ncbi:MAG: hypothetical protein A3I01_01005 [Betaproteobacteria bacterium RIFCSPLOWO2_02_FULL_65_24]|nr:MAG: hypothetical protein A3I01_01005 [Betaproteobacteria bacterium RIFCSPLOWO2_02_FULL_65_24]OGA32491.1 MAG: hypothetical protein A3G80_08610 [Betaproteobacteria bacterium RIFCSPLOWO2_12_FULL_62_13b]
MVQQGVRLLGASLRVLALAVGFGYGQGVLAQSFPVKPVRLIVPAPPGGGLDIAARQVAQGLAPRLGQPVLVENIGGASQMLGTQAMVRSEPDGYTLLYAPSTPITLAENFEPKPPYDARRDIVGVVVVLRNPGLIVTNARVKANTLPEFIALAKAQPRKLFYGSPGVGHLFHLTAELLSKQAGIEMTHVPYKGSGPAVVALLAGDIHFSIQSVEAVREHLRAGKLRALATFEPSRLDGLPEVPTLAESGLKNVSLASWHGILAPARTPGAVIATLERHLLALVKSPEFGQKMKGMNFVPIGAGSKEFARMMAAEFDVWPAVVKSIGVGAARQ